MKKNNYLAILLIPLFCCCTILSASAQELSGRIVEKDASGKETSLPMAGVKWLGSSISTSADENGKFQIPFPEVMPAKLLVAMIGYTSDTILFNDKSKTNIKIVLKNSTTTLNTVNITEKTLSSRNLITAKMNTELISQKELTLAACCNISESFERNASVDVNFTDAVSGAKQIQMLGLDGIYTQILYENLPFIRGLSSSYGLTYIPGTWVENILVTKGTGSVVNGFESITGQIQIELLEPEEAEQLYINGFVNNNQRYELNAHLAKRFKTNLSSLLFVHASKNGLENYGNMDRNNDGFLDMPLTSQYNLLNRWNFRVKNRHEGQFGVRALMEDKIGGHDHNALSDTSTVKHYGIFINTKQVETFTKNGWIYPDTPWRSFAIMTTERYQEQKSFFGIKKYQGTQKSLYVNTIYQSIINNTFHKIKFGGSFMLDDFSESFNEGLSAGSDSLFTLQEIVPGVYSEYTFNNDTNISIVAGVRADYFENYGLMVNPRLHLKYNPSKDAAIRLSGGRGMRTPHIFAENSQVFASSRQIVIHEELKQEVAWNYGMTFTYCFKPFGKEATFNLDAYRTDFENQVVVDLEDVNKVQFYNLRGLSYSNSIQTDITFSPSKKWDFKLAYKYYDVKSTYFSMYIPGTRVLLDKPLVPKDRALLNIDYTSNKEKWIISNTIKWFGKSRLPNTSLNTPEFQLPEHSTPYFTYMAQVSKKFKWFELYIGGENIFNYIIPNAIVDPGDPFGPNFDATMIWGPVNGRVIYGGFRYKII